MKKTKKPTTLVSVLSLLILVSFCLNSCSFAAIEANARGTVDLMENITPYTDEPSDNETDGESFRDSFFIFSTEIFKRTFDEKNNSLISPLSLIMALGMTANGSDGVTLTEAETLLGNLDTLNSGVCSYKNVQDGQLKTANSIWIKNERGFNVKEDFLKTNATYYGADAYLSPFDEQTLNDINSWVKKNTDGEIEKILDDLSPDAVMCLINTVLFDAEWASPYSMSFTKLTFKGANGESQPEMMTSSENVYLEGENVRGFMKSYKGGDYSFAALLPEYDISLSDFISTLDGDTLKVLFDESQKAPVRVTIPKFSYDYSISAAEIIADMGWQSAFSGEADFSRMSDTPLYISEIIHKTHIDFKASGTKAAASTAVVMTKMSAEVIMNETIRLVFDRPFMFVIYDNNNNIPVFIGAVNEIDVNDIKP